MEQLPVEILYNVLLKSSDNDLNLWRDVGGIVSDIIADDAFWRAKFDRDIDGYYVKVNNVDWDDFYHQGRKVPVYIENRGEDYIYIHPNNTYGQFADLLFNMMKSYQYARAILKGGRLDINYRYQHDIFYADTNKSINECVAHKLNIYRARDFDDDDDNTPPKIVTVPFCLFKDLDFIIVSGYNPKFFELMARPMSIDISRDCY